MTAPAGHGLPREGGVSHPVTSVSHSVMSAYIRVTFVSFPRNLGQS